MIWLSDLAVDEPLEHPGQVAGVDAVHRRAGADHGVEAEDRVLRVLRREPVDHVDLGADGEGRRARRRGDALRM